MSPFEVRGPGEEITDLPWRLKYILKQEGRAGASGENVIGHIVDMAGTGKGADVNALGRVRANVTHADWPEVQGAYMQALGRNAQGVYDPMLMLDRYAKEISTGGRNLMFGDSKAPGGLRHHMDSLVNDRARLAAIERIPERSSHVQKALLAGWAIADPISALLTVAGARAVAKYLANPATAAPIAQWSKAYVKIMHAGATPAAIASYKIATDNLRNSLGGDIDTDKLNASLRTGPKPQRSTDPGVEGGIGDIVQATMKLAPGGIKPELMRQSENVEDRKYMRPEFPRQDETWDDLKARKKREAEYKYHNEFLPSLTPGKLGQEAGLADLEPQRRVMSYAEATRSGPRNYPPIPMPRPRPKKGNK
jgi:hypothetical protein